MHRYFLSLMVLCISAHQAFSQDIPEPPAYHYATKNRCSIPANADTWDLREPTEEEILEWGRYVLIFEYWNKEAQCSDDVDQMGIYFNDLRFILDVEVLGQEQGNQERVFIDTLDTGYFPITENPMFLDDGADPGKIILAPALG